MPLAQLACMAKQPQLARWKEKIVNTREELLRQAVSFIVNAVGYEHPENCRAFVFELEQIRDECIHKSFNLWSHAIEAASRVLPTQGRRVCAVMKMLADIEDKIDRETGGNRQNG